MAGIPVLTSGYRCAVCGAQAPDAETAAACCDGDWAFGYACPICGETHETEAKAMTCSGWDRTPEGARTIRARLEEAGQLAMEL